VTVGLFLEYSAAHQLAVDFHHDFWVAGSRVLHGLDPYHWTRQQIAALACFPYPAPGALVFVPFSLLPRSVSDLMFVTLLLTACLTALRILNVRDWRVYTLVLLWWPVINAWQTANVTLLLVCGLAAVWRYRDSPAVAGCLTALMLSTKPVVWPLVLWLLITLRFRAVVYGLALTLLLNLISWSVLGFGEIDVLSRQGYGLVALAMHLGAGRTAGTALQFATTAALAVGCLYLARSRREREAFAVAIMLMLTSSPLVDNHYFALLIVPLAIARPYLCPAWILPLLLWICPATGVTGWEVAVAWVTAGSLTLWLVHGNQSRDETGIARTAWPRSRDFTPVVGSQLSSATD
jgi:hypothetical protein